MSIRRPQLSLSPLRAATLREGDTVVINNQRYKIAIAGNADLGIERVMGNRRARRAAASRKNRGMDLA